MSDIDAAENAWLEGSAIFESFIVKDQAEFFAPMERRLKMANWATMTPQEREMLKRGNPELYAAIEEEVKKLEARYAKD